MRRSPSWRGEMTTCWLGEPRDKTEIRREDVEINKARDADMDRGGLDMADMADTWAIQTPAGPRRMDSAT